jgi:hypothetical protein
LASLRRWSRDGTLLASIAELPPVRDLPPFPTLELEPKLGPIRDGILIDADTEVHESDETNNHIFVAVPAGPGPLLPWLGVTR